MLTFLFFNEKFLRIIMNKLYAPWRTEYTGDTQKGKNDNCTKDTCVFCTQFASNKDQEHGIIKRFKHTIVVLNKYPYNAGHVLLLPLVHAQNLSQLSPEARSELINVLAVATETIQNALKSDGLNVGINLGKAAGAGIPAHLHVHILPRWQGDTNFMPILAETKVVSFDLATIYKKLTTAFANVSV